MSSSSNGGGLVPRFDREEFVAAAAAAFPYADPLGASSSTPQQQLGSPKASNGDDIDTSPLLPPASLYDLLLFLLIRVLIAPARRFLIALAISLRALFGALIDTWLRRRVERMLRHRVCCEHTALLVVQALHELVVAATPPLNAVDGGRHFTTSTGGPPSEEVVVIA